MIEEYAIREAELLKRIQRLIDSLALAEVEAQKREDELIQKMRYQIRELNRIESENAELRRQLSQGKQLVGVHANEPMTCEGQP